MSLRFRGVVCGALIAVCSIPGMCQAQQQAPPPPAKPGQNGMGIAGGIGAAPVYDAEKRPITAGGFVDTGPVVFQDITKAGGALRLDPQDGHA